MHLFALTTMEKLERVPVEFWLKMAMIIAVIALSLVLIRSISQMNKVLLTISTILLVSILGFNWIYERNEPRMFTPMINKIAPFFPSKGMSSGW